MKKIKCEIYRDSMQNYKNEVYRMYRYQSTVGNGGINDERL